MPWEWHLRSKCDHVGLAHGAVLTTHQVHHEGQMSSLQNRLKAVPGGEADLQTQVCQSLRWSHHSSHSAASLLGKWSQAPGSRPVFNSHCPMPCHHLPPPTLLWFSFSLIQYLSPRSSRHQHHFPPNSWGTQNLPNSHPSTQLIVSMNTCFWIQNPTPLRICWK